MSPDHSDAVASLAAKVAVVNGTAGRVDEAQHAALVCERADERLRRAHEYLGHWPPSQWSAAECRPAADSNE